jgi:hypothetical protein
VRQALAALLVASVLSVPELSLFLQRHMNKLLGPLLILVGMFLLDLISVNLPGSGVGQTLQKRLDGLELWGALPLGMIFALTFCPVSAALYFGSLIPLSVKAQSSVLLPGLYGVGTTLPALAFAVLIAVGAHSVGRAFKALTKVEWFARRGTGIVFLGIGVYVLPEIHFRRAVTARMSGRAPPGRPSGSETLSSRLALFLPKARGCPRPWRVRVPRAGNGRQPRSCAAGWGERSCCCSSRCPSAGWCTG